MVKKTVFSLALLCITTMSLTDKPFFTKGSNPLTLLKSAGVWREGLPVRLHLGCGEIHFDEYINIDFPPANHTVQEKVAADMFADLRELTFPTESVDQVRSHHVFEHFDRQTALAFLCKWNQWLKVGGHLIIETPDFQASMEMLLSPEYTYLQKQGILRHVFGSHEASWAIHCDGWYKDKFDHVLRALGFDDIKFYFSQWQLTRNITILATKKQHTSAENLREAAKNILRESTIDDSHSENNMWHLWNRLFDDVLDA